MWIVYLAIFIGLAGVVIALIKISKNIFKQKKEPLVSEKAEIIKMNCNTRVVSSNGASTVDSSGGYESTTYHLSFKLNHGKTVAFRVPKKLYLKVSEHQTGMLTYKGYKMIKFEYEGYIVNTPQRRALSMSSFFGKKKHEGQTVAFYGEAKELDVDYHSDHKIQCDQLELNRFIDQLPRQTLENFFALENEIKQILEVSNRGESDEFEIVYMTPDSNARYIGNVTGVKILKSVVDSFFKHNNLAELYQLSEE